MTSRTELTSSRTLNSGAVQRAGALIRDCHAHEPTIRWGKGRRNVCYLYYMEADQGVDNVLLHCYRDTSRNALPPNLIGTVAKVSELRRHVRNLRQIPAYQDSVIAIRVWNHFDAGPLRWQTPLELEEGDGPIAILTDPPAVVNGVKVPRLEIHPRSRLGKQYFVHTRNETSTNVFISDVGFFETQVQRLVVKAAAAVGVITPAIGGVQAVHSLTDALGFDPTSFTAIGALGGLVVGFRYGSGFLKQSVRAWFRRAKKYSSGQDDVFMRRDLFERLAGNTLQGATTGREQVGRETLASRQGDRQNAQSESGEEATKKEEDE